MEKSKKISLSSNKTRIPAVKLLTNKKFLLWLFFYTLLFVYYFTVNYRHSGPVYTGDELGYLSKAQALAGFEIDSRTSWHGGYSLVLSPLIRLFSDSKDFWVSAVALNSLLFVASIALLKSFLQRFFPKKSQKEIFFAVLLSSVYPAWITMTGYVFPTPLFVLLVMVFANLFIRYDLENKYNLAILSVIAGLLYWVHPVGLAVVGSYMLILLITLIKTKRYLFYTTAIIFTFAIVALYALTIHPWLDTLTTQSGSFDSEIAYSFLGDNIQKITIRNFLSIVPSMFLGGLAYLVIATFGLISATFILSLKNSKKLFSSTKNISQNELVVILLVLSVIGSIIIGLSAFYLSSLSNQIRPDHLIYGRYSEMVFLPLLGISLLLTKKNANLYLSSLILIVAAIGFYLVTRQISINFDNYDYIHTPALWPKYFIEGVNYLYIIILGFVGVVMASTNKKSFAVLAALPLIFVSVYQQQQWHDARYQFTRPSGLVNYVEDELEDRGCIGFWAQQNDFFSQNNLQYQVDRIELYKYYLGKYNPQKMDYDTWINSDCSMYLTTGNIDSEDVIISYEESSKIYLLQKTSSDKQRKIDNTYRDFYVNTDSMNNMCSTELGCFSRNAEELKDFVVVGTYKDQEIITNSRGGVLFFGPYAFLKAGDYVLELNTYIEPGSNVKLNIVDGVNIIKTEKITGEADKSSYLIPFNVKEDAETIEIKVDVIDSSVVRFNDYKIILNN